MGSFMYAAAGIIKRVYITDLQNQKGFSQKQATNLTYIFATTRQPKKMSKPSAQGQKVLNNFKDFKQIFIFWHNPFKVKDYCQTTRRMIMSSCNEIRLDTLLTFSAQKTLGRYPCIVRKKVKTSILV
jgi:hypothetical protein